MSVLPLLAAATAGAAAATVLRRWPAASLAVAALAVLVMLLQLPAVVAGTSITLGDAGTDALTVSGTPLLRGLVGIGLAGGGLVVLVGLLGPEPPSPGRVSGRRPDAGRGGAGGSAAADGGISGSAPAGAVLLVAGTGLTLALAVDGATAAVIAMAATTATATALALVDVPSPARLLTLAREARGSAVALAAGLLAVGLGGTAAGGLPPGSAGLALLAAAFVAGHRLGAIPLHARVARLAEGAPRATFAVLAAWIPAAWAAILVAWAAGSLASTGPGLGLERGLIVLAGLATLVLGSVAALIQDEIEHVVAYTIVQDVGVALLALGGLDPSLSTAFDAWLVSFVGVRMALVGWAIAFRATFGTDHLRDSAGWARRAPMLAVALAVAAAASIGWPGLLAWETRLRVLQGATGGPVFLLAFLGSLGTLAAAVRVLAIGMGRPSPAVVAAVSEVPRIPPGLTWGPAGQPAGFEPGAARHAGDAAQRGPRGLDASRGDAASGARAAAPSAGAPAPGLVAPAGLRRPSRRRGGSPWGPALEPEPRFAAVSAGASAAAAAARARLGAVVAAGRASTGGLGGRMSIAGSTLAPLLAANRTPLRALLTVVLAGLAMVAAVNGLGVPRGV